MTEISIGLRFPADRKYTVRPPPPHRIRTLPGNLSMNAKNHEGGGDGGAARSSVPVAAAGTLS